MLEVVCVERAVSQRLVRQHIVVIDHDLEVIALGSQRVLDLLEDLGGVPIQPFQISELNEQAAPFGFTFEEYL